MSELVPSGEFKVLGVWTVSLLHPASAPSVAYPKLKAELLKAGGVLQAEHHGADRTAAETMGVSPEERTLSTWKVGGDTLVLREDGLMLWSDLGEAAGDLLHEVVKRLADGDEVLTFSLAPLPPNHSPADVVSMPLAAVLEPINQGPFLNARTWTVVDHIHDGLDTRARFYSKIGIEIEIPEDRKKKKAKA